MKMEKPVNVSNCIIEATSGSDIIINDLTTRIIRGRASGGSDLKLTEKRRTANIPPQVARISKAYDLILNQLECSASGGSDIYTHVTDYIKASASGGSDVHYKGSARSDTSTSGGSDIIKRVINTLFFHLLQLNFYNKSTSFSNRYQQKAFLHELLRSLY